MRTVSQTDFTKAAKPAQAKAAKKGYYVTYSVVVERTVLVSADSAENAQTIAEQGYGTVDSQTEGEFEVLEVSEAGE